MKHGFSILLLSAVAGLVPFAAAFGQTIIQHTGANDPVGQGFILDIRGDAQLGPVVDDNGFDSWMIHSRLHTEAASYAYPLTTSEQTAAANQGWSLSANLRFVEVSEHARALLFVQMGTKRFRVGIAAAGTDEMVFSGDIFGPISFEGNPTEYHAFSLVYDALSETAALWVNGTVVIPNITGGEVATPAMVGFGATGESITHSHWNEVTFAIIPEPATAALLVGAGALLAVGVWRRRRRGRFQT